MTYPWSSGEILTAADLNAYAGLIFITKVDFTTQNTVNVNNVFSSAHRTYRLVVTLDSSSTLGYLYLRMRTGSTTSGTSYYEAIQALDFGGTATNLTLSNGAYWRIGAVSPGTSGSSGSSVDIYQPHTTEYTVHHFGAIGTGVGYVEHFTGGGLHASSTSYDGFTLSLAGSDTMTGRVCVYGYND